LLLILQIFVSHSLFLNRIELLLSILTVTKGNRMQPTQTCLVTGANAGLGKALATGLAGTGARVILLCRDSARGAVARDEIKALSHNTAIDLVIGDLASQASIRATVEKIHALTPSLEVLINNAAVYKSTYTTTPDGLETMFETNHLGYFLLTLLTFDLWKPNGRILNITAPSTTRLNFDDLQGAQKFNALTAFGASKMANLLFTFSLAKRLEGQACTVNAVSPGLVRSSIMREVNVLVRAITFAISQPPEKAAQGILPLATEPEFSTRSGRLFQNRRELQADSYAYDAAIQQRLWSTSLELTGLPPDLI
jgi:NAD(P)-dependent dehydrogenase (short-subunit alcohol dehydrogenase family)